MLIANVYVSEGRDAQRLHAFQEAARACRGSALLQHFTDAPYNRTSFTLAARSSQLLAGAAVALARCALAALDFRQHAASHPRLGTVDHISCHPLGAADGRSLEQAAQAASQIGTALAEDPGLPCYLYGHASPARTSLAELRRRLGYFASSKGQWDGSRTARQGTPVLPDLGPAKASVCMGVITLGAGPWVSNVNCKLQSADLPLAKAIARSVAERHGGLPGVQAMALLHIEGPEVACNILDEAATTSAAVLERRVAELARQSGARLGSAYRIGLPLHELRARAEAALGSGASS